MFPWYDSWWLAEYERAKRLLAHSSPAILDRFIHEMRVFRTDPAFTVQTVDGLLDEADWKQVHQTIAALRHGDLDMTEAKAFGRFVARNCPYFSGLQRRLTAFVSERVGEPVEPAYNFLSLYGAPGVCAPHMDAPSAKWTLDLCVAQSAPWPIYFSQVVPWPEAEDRPQDHSGEWLETVKASPSLQFEPVALEPGQAVIFSGSSQWHYRDRMPPGTGRQFCELLFFHYLPAGTRDLVAPEKWADLFGAPELTGLVPQTHGAFI
ncbi:MAG: hypothetical protein M3Q55_16790 [Acidobacteriota bacterium]|nr:hypothetical protein [Acidobacteriota bacterium]